MKDVSGASAVSKRFRQIAITSIALALGITGCSDKPAESRVGQTAQVAPSQSAAVSAARAAIRVTGDVSFGGQYETGGVAWDPSSHLVYVANPQSNTVSVVDPKTKSVTRKINVDNHPTEVAVDSTSQTLLVTQVSGSSPDTRSLPGTLSFIDLKSGSVTATVDVGTGPSGLAVDSGTAYVGRAQSTSVVAIDLNSHTTRNLAITPGGRCGGIAVDTTTHLIYAVDGNNSQVTIADPSGTIVGTVPIGSMPRGLGVDAGNKTAYAPSTQGSITVIDTAAKSVKATIDTGSSPGTIGIDTSSHIVYSTDKDGKVFAIDPATNTVLASFDVGQFPATPVVDPETHTVFIAASGVLSFIEP